MLDLALVLAFVVYAISSGLRARRRASEGLEQYFLAGRSIAGWRAGTSMAATQFAADTPLLVTGLIATAGVWAVWRLWVYGLAFLRMAFVLAGPWRRARVITDAELTEVRYGGRGVLALRVLKAIYYGTVINCVVMAVVLVAATRIAEVFLPWHQWLPAGAYGGWWSAVRASGLTLGESVTGLDPVTLTADHAITLLLVLAFTALYSTTGGLRSVIATDVLQFSLAIAGTAAYAWIAADKAGGLAALPSTLAGVYGGERAGAMLSWLPPPGELLMPFLIVIGLQWLFQMNADGTGYLAQRSMACATDAGARRAGVLFAWLQIVLRSVLWLVIGTALLVLYPIAAADAAAPDPAAREITFVLGIADHLPAGISGLMLVGLLAALASTLDTHLNWGASYWSNDVYRRLVCETWLRREPGRRELVMVARLSNVLILAVALAITARLGSIQTAWFVSLLFGAGMGSVLVLRWLWERITLWSELAAMACSIVAAPILLVATDAEWVRLALMAAISTTAAVAAALLGPPNDPAVTASFYRRVRPAGWWGRAAAANGEPATAPRRRLGRQLAVTAAAAGSLFLALVGFGRLALPAAASWPLVPVVSLVGAAVLAPVWMHSLRDEDAAGVG